MKILLLGCTGQEHAMARQFKLFGHDLYCHAANAGIESLAKPVNPDQDPLHFAKKEGIDLAVTSSDALLAGGISDLFASEGLRFFGPTSFASRLGNSRLFAKRFMERAAIPTPRYTLCRTLEEVSEAAHQFDWNVVLKSAVHSDALPVTSASSRTEVEAIFAHHWFEEELPEVIVEERIEGEEISLIFFCDGERLEPMPPVVDQKQLCDGGVGPGTGGMGAYVPMDIPFLEAIEERIVAPTRRELQRGGFAYRGNLSLVVVVTPSGPQLLEYRCQCGDPEAQVVLPLLCSDLAQTMCACVDGDLGAAPPQWRQERACTVVLAAGGYPNRSNAGGEVVGLSLLDGLDSIYAYHDGTALDAGRVVTAGGRVLSITGIAPTLERAIERAYQGAGVVDFPDKVYREDIGLTIRT